MKDLVRLVYASRATFKPGHAGEIDVEVARILMQSRRHNPRAGLVGALYYSDGLFFQCLEGTVEAVEGLYARLHNDPRHKDLSVLQRQAITQPSFSTWAMKYVPNASEVNALLARHKLASFDPYRFDPPMIDAMVALLLRGTDFSPMTGPGPKSTAPAPAPAATPESASERIDAARILRRSTLAVILASLALALAAAALALVLLR